MASALSMSNRRLSNQPLSMRDRNTLSRFCRAPRASCRRFPTSSGWYLDRNLRRGEEEPNSHWRPEPGYGEGPREVRAQPPSSHPQKVITMEMGGGVHLNHPNPQKGTRGYALRRSGGEPGTKSSGFGKSVTTGESGLEAD